MLRTRHAGTVPHSLQVVPSSAHIYRTTQALLHPARDFRPTPQPPICWRALQGLCQFGLLFSGKQGLASCDLMAMILDAFVSLGIPPLDNGTNPPSRVAKQFSYFAWRFALLHLPQDVPVGPLHRILRVPIALMKLFRCHIGLDLDSFCHTTSIHDLDGFHMIYILLWYNRLHCVVVRYQPLALQCNVRSYNRSRDYAEEEGLA